MCLLVQTAQFVAFCDGSPSTLMHFLSFRFRWSIQMELSGTHMKMWDWDAEEGQDLKQNQCW